MTLYRKLEVALILAIEVEIIQKLVFLELYELIGVVGMPYLLRHLGDLKMIRLLDKIGLLARMHAVMRHSQRALNDGMLGILPLLGVIAHQE